MRSITKLAFGLAVTLPLQAMEQHMDAMPVAKLAVDHLEQRFDGDEQALAWELEATYGNDLHKAVLKSSGERADGGAGLRDTVALAVAVVLAGFGGLDRDAPG